MLAPLRLARARRMNARLSRRAATLRELDDAVRAWERLHAASPEDWWTLLGLAEALLRRGDRARRAHDLRRGMALFDRARRIEDRPFVRVGWAMCAVGAGDLEGDADLLRRAAEACAALRRERDAPLSLLRSLLLAESSARARLGEVAGDARESQRAAALAAQAEGLAAALPPDHA